MPEIARSESLEALTPAIETPETQLVAAF